MKLSPELHDQIDVLAPTDVVGQRALMWFRDDLRTRHHEALASVVERAGRGAVALFVHETNPDFRPLGGASRWWLNSSLRALAEDLAHVGVPLIVGEGNSEEIVPAVVEAVGADYVAWSRRYHRPYGEADERIKEKLQKKGAQAEDFAGFLLSQPWEILSGKGEPYKVFTPFSKQAFAAMEEEMGVPPTPQFAGHDGQVAKVSLPLTLRAIEGLRLLPQAPEPDWTAGLKKTWLPGQEGAHQRLDTFLDGLTRGDVTGYAHGRDFPAQPATSGLSPHLRFGEISPHYVWHKVASTTADNPEDQHVFLKQLLWRDFAWNRLYHRPDLATVSVKEEFRAFPWAREWASASEELRAWRAGRTGIPLVDAGMRELALTGTMHNRVRMVVGSLLTKNLMIHWRHGEEWFWDQLVDADHACNAFNWQWVAGCGDDAAPYFRIFNPETQASRFDPDGTYIARWVPEALQPGYLPPLVDLKESRHEALAAYQQVRALRK